MKHTFLLEESKWTVKGTYTDKDSMQMDVEGEIVISHGRDEWVDDSFIRLKADKPIKFENIYEIEPFKKGKDYTKWVSYNPYLGKLEGSFAIVGDSILSDYISEDKNVIGQEFFIKTDDSTYESRGIIFSNGKRLSSWMIRLTKVEE